MSERTYRGFEQLEAWQEARKLRTMIYSLTRDLPPEEKYVLVPQMRRAVLSVTNNIAEGHGRFHYQENTQFLRLARGSLEEVLDDVTLCEDEKYAPAETLASLRAQINSVERLLNGYIRYLLNQKNAIQARESSTAYAVGGPPGFESRITDHQSPVTDPGSRP